MLRNDSLPLRVALKRLNLTHESKGLELSLSEDARITTRSTCKRSNLKCNACTTKWTLTNYIIELLKLQVRKCERSRAFSVTYPHPPCKFIGLKKVFI